MDGSVTLRPELPVDKPGVRRVVETAFGQQGKVVADLVESLARHVALSLVAEVGGAVVGHVQLSRSWVDARQHLVDVLVLSPLSVLPEHQGKGIGGGLVTAA